MVKRTFDVVVSTIALVVLSPMILVIAVLVRIDSAGPSLFRQTRVGKSFRPFQLLKFRSMVSGNSGAEITCGNEARITRLGAILRNLKLDELPQLWNVLRGDMSFVGPRPEVPTFVEHFREDYEQLLQVRPGITDPASIRYRSESQLLSSVPDPISYYRNVILPDKISVSRAYVQSASVKKDLSIIAQTLVALFRG